MEKKNPKPEREIREQIAMLQVVLSKANAHYQIGMGLRENWSKIGRSMDRASTFWDFTLEAHLNVAFMHVCRAYVEQRKAVTLPMFLGTVVANWNLFDEHEFRRRCAGYPDQRIEELVAARWNPDRNRLAADKEFCSKTNPAVSDLIKWRHMIAMHIDSQWLGDRRKDFMKRWPLPDIKRLIDGGLEIVDRYDSAFQTAALQPPLQLDDYLCVLECLS